MKKSKFAPRIFSGWLVSSLHAVLHTLLWLEFIIFCPWFIHILISVPHTCWWHTDSFQKQSFISETPVVIWTIQFHIGQDTLYSVTWCSFIVRQTVELFIHRFEICFGKLWKRYFLLVNPTAPSQLISCSYYLLLLSASAFQQVSFPLCLKIHSHPFISYTLLQGSDNLYNEIQCMKNYWAYNPDFASLSCTLHSVYKY